MLHARAIARGWNAVLAVIVTAAMLAQLVLLLKGGSDANSAQAHIQVALTRLALMRPGGA